MRITPAKECNNARRSIDTQVHVPESRSRRFVARPLRAEISGVDLNRARCRGRPSRGSKYAWGKATSVLVFRGPDHLPGHSCNSRLVSATSAAGKEGAASPLAAAGRGVQQDHEKVLPRHQYQGPTARPDPLRFRRRRKILVPHRFRLFRPGLTNTPSCTPARSCPRPAATPMFSNMYRAYNAVAGPAHAKLRSEGGFHIHDKALEKAPTCPDISGIPQLFITRCSSLQPRQPARKTLFRRCRPE